MTRFKHSYSKRYHPKLYEMVPNLGLLCPAPLASFAISHALVSLGEDSKTMNGRTGKAF
jgi:hypothetical protein